ncbi:TetR/AcrR family transcriptional regulator [Amycolatopsis sp. DSM 110486]|uniref:TetR/AcrR family transcriptional regulator n=1 Tax=Amycolatopsis sp. DSM 110486 TaxID=2865832 RepID=UPI001C69B9AD|nr:TetR/AcrR family transcriptional regulator [Amycolatopsis sp. DSM 110486]QYN24721.1 TetR/AcrR family transcriptional regulator [Amycolatopsis sp. DSM 110486]
MTGLRERKKQATRTALSSAALRLARERGPENVRVDDIAEAAGVSPRTYNNYFASREDAIVFAVTSDRETRVAAAVRASLGSLADAVVEAVVTQYTEPGEDAREALLLITTSPALRTAYARSAGALEPPLTSVLAERVPDGPTARVLAAAVAAAVRIALEQWAQPVTSGFVVVSGSLPDLLRSALAPLVPALTAAQARPEADSGS